MMLRALIVVLLGLVMAGCGSETAAPRDSGSRPDTTGRSDEPAPSGSKIGGEYVSDGLPPPYGEGDVLRMRFGVGELSLQATCNSFSGTASWDTGVLQVGGLGGTEMGCPGEGHRQDRWLTDFLTSAPEISVDGTDVRLAAHGTEIWLVPADEVAPEPGPDVDLVGTHWRLTGIEEVDGDAASFLVATGYGADLTVDNDSIGFDTGCNAGGGDVRIEGDRLQLRNVVTTLRACLDERADVEEGVMAVLGEKRVSWSIDGNELRLTVGRTSLVYRAA